ETPRRAHVPAPPPAPGRSPPPGARWLPDKTDHAPPAAPAPAAPASAAAGACLLRLSQSPGPDRAPRADRSGRLPATARCGPGGLPPPPQDAPGGPAGAARGRCVLSYPPPGPAPATP